MYKAITDWENLRKGVDINYDQINRIASYMSPNHFEKNSLKLLDKDATYKISNLQERRWLKTDKVWYEAFDDAPQRIIRYIRRMRRMVKS